MSLNDSLGGYKLTTVDGKIAYYKESEGADSAVPFSSSVSEINGNIVCGDTTNQYETHFPVEAYNTIKLKLIASNQANVYVYKENTSTSSNIIANISSSTTYTTLNITDYKKLVFKAESGSKVSTLVWILSQ